MTADDAMHALRTAIRADLIAELQTYRDTLHTAEGDDDLAAGAMDGNYLDGLDDAIRTLEAA